jgi:4,4'-diapolycopenoate synthase
VQVLHSSPKDAVRLIDAGPDYVFFTGNSENGQLVARRAARNIIPTVLELGGNDAAIVFADCHLQRAVEGIVYGAFSNTGRVCVAVKRAYAEASIYEEFLAALKKRVAKLRVGAKPEADLYPLPQEALVRFHAQMERAVLRGARILWPPASPTAIGQPVVLSDIAVDSRVFDEEYFGPVLFVAKFANEDEAISLANSSYFALSSSVRTGDHSRARRVAARLSAGSCASNDVVRVIANPHAPFGGNRFSGYGRYHGPEGLRSFSRVKTIMWASDRRKREGNWFPLSKRTEQQLTKLIGFRHDSGLLAKLGRLFLPLLSLAIGPLAITQKMPRAVGLSVDVLLPNNARGRLGYLIFDSQSGFPDKRDKAVRAGFLAISPNARVVRINAGLPPGNYAVSVYDDLNNNGKLDRNVLGIPREPVGASNNPLPRFGPPRFRDCTFQIGLVHKVITIALVNPS